MTTKKKPGFGGQWVQVLRAGTHRDSEGRDHKIDTTFLEAVVSNFNVELHEPPAVIGHPETNTPAYGWVSALRKNGDHLEAQFCETDPQFEEMVAAGRFKKRSAALYMDKQTAPGGKVPSLMHVGFLGAKPPAVKGLRNIELNASDATVFEITFSEGAPAMTEDEKKAAEEAARKTIREQIAAFFKEHFGVKDEKGATAFSEADAQVLVDKAIAAADAKFSETIKERDEKIAKLEQQVGQQAGSSRRAEIVSFCQDLGVEKVLPAFKQMGLVEFMEALAAASDSKVAIVTFEQQGDSKVEKKTEVPLLDWFKNFLSAMPPYVKFGEQFGVLKLNSENDGSEIVDSGRMASMRNAIGLKEPEIKK